MISMNGHSNPLDTRLFKMTSADSLRNLFTVLLVVHFNSTRNCSALRYLWWTSVKQIIQYDLSDRDPCVSRVRPHVCTHLRRPRCNTSWEGAGDSSCIPWLPQAEPSGQPAPGQWRKTQKGHRGQPEGSKNQLSRDQILAYVVFLAIYTTQLYWGYN